MPPPGDEEARQQYINSLNAEIQSQHQYIKLLESEGGAAAEVVQLRERLAQSEDKCARQAQQIEALKSVLAQKRQALIQLEEATGAAAPRPKASPPATSSAPRDSIAIKAAQAMAASMFSDMEIVHSQLQEFHAAIEDADALYARSEARTRLMQESAKSDDARMAELIEQVKALRDEQRMKQAEVDRVYGELDVAKQAALGLQQELDSMRQQCSDLEKKVPVQGVLSRQQQNADKSARGHRQSKLVPDDLPLVSFHDDSAVFAKDGVATTNGSSRGDEGSQRMQQLEEALDTANRRIAALDHHATQAQDLEQALESANARIRELMQKGVVDLPGRVDTLELREVLRKLQKELNGEKKRTSDLTQQLSSRDVTMQDMKRDYKILREILHQRERELLQHGGDAIKLNAEMAQRRQVEEQLRNQITDLNVEISNMKERAEDYRTEIFELATQLQGAQAVLLRQQQKAEKGAQRHRQSKSVPDDVPLVSFHDDSSVFASCTNDGESIGGNVEYHVFDKDEMVRMDQKRNLMEAELIALNLAIQNANDELRQQHDVIHNTIQERDNAIQERDEARAQISEAMRMIENHRDLIEGLVAEKNQALTQWHAARQSLDDFQERKDAMLKTTLQTLEFNKQESLELQQRIVLQEQECHALQAQLEQLQKELQAKDSAPLPLVRESPHARALRSASPQLPPTLMPTQKLSRSAPPSKLALPGSGAGGEASSSGTLNEEVDLYTKEIDARDAEIKKLRGELAEQEAQIEELAAQNQNLSAEAKELQSRLDQEISANAQALLLHDDSTAELGQVRADYARSMGDAQSNLEQKTREVQELQAEKSRIIRSMKADQAALEAKLQEAAKHQASFEAEKEKMKVSMSLLRAQMDAEQEKLRQQMTSKCDSLVRQRDELGEALRAEKDGIETQLKAELLSLKRDLEERESALSILKRDLAERESVLSIVHGDFDRALKQAAPDLQGENEELQKQVAREQDQVLEALGLLATRDQELHDALVARADLESQLDNQHNKSSLEISVLSAKVREYEEQVHHLQELLHLKRTRSPVIEPTQDPSQPSSWAIESMGDDRERERHNDEIQEKHRDLRASRRREEGLEKRVQELTQEVAALKIQILVFDEMKVDGNEEGGEEVQDDGGLHESLRLKQQSIRDEMEASLQNSAGLQQMIDQLQFELSQEREVNKELMQELGARENNQLQLEEFRDTISPLPSVSQLRARTPSSGLRVLDAEAM